MDVTVRIQLSIPIIYGQASKMTPYLIKQTTKNVGDIMVVKNWILERLTSKLVIKSQVLHHICRVECSGIFCLCFSNVIHIAQVEMECIVLNFYDHWHKNSSVCYHAPYFEFPLFRPPHTDTPYKQLQAVCTVGQSATAPNYRKLKNKVPTYMVGIPLITILIGMSYYILHSVVASNGLITCTVESTNVEVSSTGDRIRPRRCHSRFIKC